MSTASVKIGAIVIGIIRCILESFSMYTEMSAWGQTLCRVVSHENGANNSRDTQSGDSKGNPHWGIPETMENSNIFQKMAKHRVLEGVLEQFRFLNQAECHFRRFGE